MKILHVIDTLSAGGAETWLMELLRFWRTQGTAAPQMDIFATSGNQGPYDNEARALGTRIFYYRFSRSTLPSFVRGWREVLRDGNYNAIHDHQEFISGWHFLAGFGLLPAVRVTHVHNPILDFTSYYGVSKVRCLTANAGWRLVDRLATHICGTSDEILRRHNYKPGSTAQHAASVIYCGFEVGKFSSASEPDRQSVLNEFGWAPDTKIVLSVGRLDFALDYNHSTNHKNTWLAINVARMAADRDGSVRYLLAGAGASSRAIQEHVRQWGLEDRFRLIGVRNDVPRLMRAADVLLFPSVEEGLGMVAVEAQAAGLPVLASTAVPRECVVVPQLYNTMPLSEPPGAWAVALLEIIARERPDRELCDRALKDSAFSIANSAKRLMDIYKSVNS